MRRAALLCALACTLASPAAAFAAAPKASLVDIEDEVMCTTCKIPLNIAESEQADRERALIRGYIALHVVPPSYAQIAAGANFATRPSSGLKLCLARSLYIAAIFCDSVTKVS